MPAGLSRPSVDENASSALASSVAAGASSMDVTLGHGVKFVAPCYLVIDRVDAAGALKPVAQWEYVKVTNVSTDTLTITRAQGGSTDQAHSSGAVVEAVVTSSMFEDWYNALNPEHTAAGGHILGTATVTTHLQLSNASISGLQRTFVWYAPGYASGATTNVMRLIAPFGGTFQAFTAMPRTPVSGASLTLDLNKNGTSIFDTIGRPAILGGGTFVSTASIATKNFIAGDILTLDIDTGGNVADITLEGIAY